MQVDYNSKPIPRRQIKTLIHRFKILMSTNHSASGVSRQKKISRDKYYRVVNNYAAGGLPALLDKSRAPHNRLETKALHGEIICTALHNPKAGFREISDRLRQSGITRCFKTINNILRKEGLSKPDERIRFRETQDRESEMYQ